MNRVKLAALLVVGLLCSAGSAWLVWRVSAAGPVGRYGGIVLGLLVLLVVWWGVGREIIESVVMASRAAVQMVPSREHNPTPEVVRAVMASSAQATHRVVLDGLGLTSRADTLILTHRVDDQGRMVFVATGPKRAMPGVRGAAGAYGNGVVLRDVASLTLPWAPLAPPPGAVAAGPPPRHLCPEDEELEPGAPQEAGETRRRLYTHRQALEVVGRDTAALALNPNLSTVAPQLATALCGLSPARGEDGQLTIHLRPLSPREAATYRRKLGERMDGRKRPGIRGVAPATAVSSFMQGVRGQSSPQGTASGFAPFGIPVGGTPRASQSQPLDELARVEMRADQRRLDEQEPLFHVRVMIVVRATSPERARNAVNAMHEALATRAAGARFAVRASYLPRPLALLGALASNWPLVRNAFDARLRDALMRPTPHPLMASEIAPLVTPAPAAAEHPGIRRTAPVDPAPTTIPVYRGGDTPDLLPLVDTTTGDGTLVRAAIPVSDVTHVYACGRSGAGKTETAMAWAIHLAKHRPDGWAFIDPQGNAIDRLLPHLTQLDRPIYLIDLRRDEQPSWAVLSMVGKRPAEADKVVTANLDAIANLQGWDTRNQRAQTLLEMSLATLVEVNSKLVQAGHPELQTTPLMTPRLIGNAGWRESLLPYTPTTIQDYWTTAFPSLPRDAAPVVTNLYNALPGRHSPRGTLLGQPVGTFDAQTAMEEGAIVLVCTDGISNHARLIANLFLFELFRAAMGRKKGPDFWLFADEAQVFDGGSHGKIAESLELLRQWRFHMMLMNQSPERLSAATRMALFTNRSALMTSAVRDTDARMLAQELGGLHPDAVRDIDPHNWIVRPTVHGRLLRPFAGHGVPLSAISDPDPEGVPALLNRIHTDTEMRTRTEVTDMIDRLPDRIAAYLDGGGSARSRPKKIDLTAAGTTRG